MKNKSVIPSFMEDGIPVFIGAKPKDIACYVILCVRDPLLFSEDPAVILSKYLDDIKKMGETRMFTTYTGKYKGTSITICLTGSGAAETELALAQFIEGYPHVNTFIRLGACGGFQPDVDPGIIAIANGAVRDEGSSKEYVAPTFPAFANYEVLLAQIEAAEKLNAQYSVGIFRSNDTMYPGFGRPLKGYIQEEHKKIVEYWSKANVSFIERETSLILTMTNLLRLRGGSACMVVDNYFTGEIVPANKLRKDVEGLVQVVFESFNILDKWDGAKKEKGKKWLTSSTIKEVEK